MARKEEIYLAAAVCLGKYVPDNASFFLRSSTSGRLITIVHDISYLFFVLFHCFSHLEYNSRCL